MAGCRYRVLHILTGSTGGAAWSTVTLIEGLKARSIDSAIYCSNRASSAEFEELAHHVQGRFASGPLYYWHRRTRKPWWKRPLILVAQLAWTRCLIRSTAEVVDACRKFGIDLIHSSTAIAPEGAIAARVLGLPHIWHVRELIGPSQPYRLRGDRSSSAPRRLLRTGTVVANSKTAANVMFGSDATGQVWIVPNGFPLDQLLAVPAGCKHQGSITFGMIANLTADMKQHDLFVKASAEARSMLPAAKFVLVGRDPYLEALGSRSSYASKIHALVDSLGLNDVFTFKGQVDNPMEALEGIDVLVHPTEGESFGRVFVEAGAAARPVIAVDAGAAPEIVIDGVSGLIVPPRDPQAIADAMTRLAMSPSMRQELGAGGRRLATKRYQLQAYSARIDSVYQLAPPQPKTRSFVEALYQIFR